MLNYKTHLFAIIFTNYGLSLYFTSETNYCEVIMDSVNLSLYLDAKSFMWVAFYFTWILITEYFIYRPLITLERHAQQKYYANYQADGLLNDVTTIRKYTQQRHDHLTNIDSLHKTFLKLIPVSILLLFLISNPLNVVPEEIHTKLKCCYLSMSWCLLRYLNILHADPDVRRWRLLQTNQIGCGLAHNYWDGYLQNFVLARPDVLPDSFESTKNQEFKDRRDFINIVDLIRKFEDEHLDWIRIPKTLRKLVVLIDYSCNFEKDKRKWPDLYGMEVRQDENDNMPKITPRIPIKMSSKTREFGVNLVRVRNPDNEKEYFHIVLDAPMILRSAMGSETPRVADPDQKRRNVEDFIETLEKMLKTHCVTEQAEIICFNDVSLPTTKSTSIYKVIQTHLAGKSLVGSELSII